MKTIVICVVASLAAGCHRSHQHVEELPNAYIGMQRADLTASIEPWTTYDEDDLAKLPEILDRAARVLPAGSPPVVRVDTFLRARNTVGSSFGIIGLYEDFVFYDATDRVIAVGTKFLD